MAGVLSEQRERLAREGRNGDTRMSHTTEGELVVPRGLLRNPQVRSYLQSVYADAGLDLGRYIVGSPEGPVNPRTGAEEFFDDGSGTASDADANDDGTTSDAEAAAADGFSGGDSGSGTSGYGDTWGDNPGQGAPAAAPGSGANNAFEESLGFENPMSGRSMTLGDLAMTGLGMAVPGIGIVSTIGGALNAMGAEPSTDSTPGHSASKDGNDDGGGMGARFVFDPRLGRIVDTGARG